MRRERRQESLRLLFSTMVDTLDELQERGVYVPSDVFVALGELRGNVSGYLEHVASIYDSEIKELEILAKAELIEEADIIPEADTEQTTESGEEEEELTRMEQVSAKNTKIPPARSPMENHKNVVNMRNKPGDDG